MDGKESDAYATAYEQLEAIARLTGGGTYSPHLVEELSGAYGLSSAPPYWPSNALQIRRWALPISESTCSVGRFMNLVATSARNV